MPSVVAQQPVTRPAEPIVAMKANASVTPPNWARTPHAAVTPAGSGRPAR